MPDHQDDSYGACTVCREYVPHTDEETVKVAWPCATVRLDAALARERALLDVLREEMGGFTDAQFVEAAAHGDYGEAIRSAYGALAETPDG